MALSIVDKPGRITVQTMREYFEWAVNTTPLLKALTPLGVVTINDQFSHYINPETSACWIGFALGMRCAEKIQAQKAKQKATFYCEADFVARACRCGGAALFHGAAVESVYCYPDFFADLWRTWGRGRRSVQRSIKSGVRHA
ncbi:MAG: hypothetical protein WC091_01270 [Sulfuricellaceae bacterium]